MADYNQYEDPAAGGATIQQYAPMAEAAYMGVSGPGAGTYTLVPGSGQSRPPGLTVSQEELLLLIGVDGTPESLKSHWALAGPLARHLELINIPDAYGLNEWILKIYHTLVSRYLDDDWDAAEDTTFKDRSYFNEQQLMLIAEALVSKSVSFYGGPRERELLATYFTSSYTRIRGDEPPKQGGVWAGIVRTFGGGRGRPYPQGGRY
jgi:hypothetical protein